jgi:hypothetical protein
MKLYGSLESLLEYDLEPDLAPASRHAPERSSDALGDIMKGKVAGLAEIVGDISRDIDGRGVLSRYILGAIYGHYIYLSSKLAELTIFAMGSNRIVEQRRSGLERQIDTLKQEARAERLKRWQDVAALKTELRTWLKQYRDLLLRAHLVLGSSRNAPQGQRALPR